MSISAIGPNYQNQMGLAGTTAGEEGKRPDASTEISRLNTEIQKAESEMKGTMKDLQSAVGKGKGGSSEKVQILQNKVQMQQQTILMKQLKVKELESPQKPAAQQAPANAAGRPRVDRYTPGEDISGQPDNVYRVEKRNGEQTILFNRPENEGDSE